MLGFQPVVNPFPDEQVFALFSQLTTEYAADTVVTGDGLQTRS